MIKRMIRAHPTEHRCQGKQGSPGLMGDQGASDRNRMRPLDGETGACLCDATVLVVEAGAELGWLSCWQPAMTATSRVPVASRRDRPSTIMWPSRSIPGGLSLDLVHLLG